MKGQEIMSKDSRSSRKDHTARWINEGMMTKAGGEDRLLETKYKYDSTKEMGKDIDGRGTNRWQGRQTKTERVNRKRRNNKEGERCEGRQRRKEEWENWRRGRVARKRARDTGRLQTQKDKITRTEDKGGMATRRRARIEENEASRERSSWDKKGKGMAKEETPEEIYLIQEDSEEDVEMYDSDREEGEPVRERIGRMAKHGTEEK